MRTSRSLVRSLAASLAAAAFIWLTSGALPSVVASHFDGAGHPNGFMPRSSYVVLLVLTVFAVPLLLSIAPLIASGTAGERLNLPNKSYWLHPDRRDSTLDYIARHARWFAYGVTVFLCYVHWLVVRANAVQPALLSSPAMIAGLVAFLIALLAWLAVLYVHFRTPSASR
jgi:apolipoprotein N-acyltransferase